MIRTPILAALTLFAAAPVAHHSAAERDRPAATRSYRAIERVHWSYRDETVPGGQSRRQLRFSHAQSSSSLGVDDSADARSIAASLEGAHAGDPVSFALVREAGALACAGRAEGSGRAAGSCRLDPDEGFVAGLVNRGLVPEDSDELLALTLVDAHLATADGLAGQGFELADAGDLIAVCALGVTAAYARELRAAGLQPGDLGDLIAARALKIDSAWLHAMAGAGYPNLAMGQAIQMRALGVTPDYAMRVGRVLRAVGQIE